MVHFFAAMLWIAATLAIVAGMPQLGYPIFVVIVLNASLHSCRNTARSVPARRSGICFPAGAPVLRDGAFTEIDAFELVPDDLVLLQAGDRISADMRLIRASALSIDGSVLTGETFPVTPQKGDLVLAGTFVVEGQGQATIIATGCSTRLAGIAHLAEAGGQPPPAHATGPGIGSCMRN